MGARDEWADRVSVRRGPVEVTAVGFDEAAAGVPAHLRTWGALVDGAEFQLAVIRAWAVLRSITIQIIGTSWNICRV